jgi:predicted DNA repair protein MutK
MPPFLKVLSMVGTLAMLWVGGGIIIHGLHEFGVAWPEKFIHTVAHGVGGAIPFIGWLVEWLVGAALAGVVGVAVGFLAERTYHAVKDQLPKAPKFTDF